MKRYFIIFLSLFLTLNVAGQNKKFDKILKEVDILENVKNVPFGHFQEFWNAAVTNNKRIDELKKAAEKNTLAFQAAKKDMNESYPYVQLAIQSQQTFDVKFVTDTLISHTGIHTMWPKLTLDVVADESVNAYCYPEGQVYITDALLKATNYNYEQLLGVFVHECAHVLLLHHYTSALAIQKKLITNSIVAAGVSAANVAATAYAQANGAADEKSWEQVNESITQLANAAYDDATHRFRYKYSRTQEFEADVVAYRFLEWFGLGRESYINVLESIAKDDDLYYSNDSDHPKASDRVALLKYIASTCPMH